MVRWNAFKEQVDRGVGRAFVDTSSSKHELDGRAAHERGIAALQNERIVQRGIALLIETAVVIHHHLQGRACSAGAGASSSASVAASVRQLHRGRWAASTDGVPILCDGPTRRALVALVSLRFVRLPAFLPPQAPYGHG